MKLPSSRRNIMEIVAERLARKTHPIPARATCHPDRPIRTRGLCQACYQRNRVNGTLAAYPLVHGTNYHRGLERMNVWMAAVGEAMSLLALESGGCVANRRPCTRKCADIGDVLDMTAGDKQALRDFVDAHPEEHRFVTDAIRFRQMVSEAVYELRQQRVAA